MTTKPNLLRRIYHASVWGPNAIPEEDRRFRGLFQWVLPLIDLAFIHFGLAGWYAGLSTVQQATSLTWQSWWSLGIALCASVALVGVAFPRLWYIEVIGKAPMIGLMVVYLVLYLSRSTQNQLLWATAGLYLTFALLPTWRLSDLGYVWWKRRVARAKRDLETGEIAL